MNKRPRSLKILGRLALAGTATWLAYHAYRKKQLQREAPHQGISPPIAPELTRTALINGVLMRWEEHGERETSQLPVIMVHGIPTNPRIWRYVIPRLTRSGLHCLAWELVGFGWSINAGLGRDISIPKQVEYLRAWLDDQGIDQAVFVGHDVGGGVMQGLLAAYPERVAGLLLVDTVAFDNWPVVAMEMARQFHFVFDKLPPILLKPIFHVGLRNLGHDNAQRGREAATLLWEPYNSSTGPAGFANQARHVSSRDTQAIADHLPPDGYDIPVRIVWGEKDSLSIESAERLATLLEAPLHCIPGGRHFNPEDHPVIVADEILNLLGSVAQLPTPSGPGPNEP